MRSNRPVVLLLILIIAMAGLTIARRSRRPGEEPEIGLIPGSSPAGLAGASRGRFSTILEEYLEADHSVAEAIRAAPEERKAAELHRRQELRRTFGDRFLRMARESAGNPAVGDVVDALTWVIGHCPDDPQGRQAVESLLQAPVLSERLAGACRQLDAEESPIAEPVYREVLRRNPHDSARAQASLALARALRRRSERAGRAPDERPGAPGPAREAESLCEDAIARYGPLRIGRETVASVAEAELFELRSLGIGHKAPEIEGPDLEGRPMALSDFRGKVVVLEFWGDWCSVSRASTPPVRSLVERMKGRPFVLLGVNGDNTQQVAGSARPAEAAERSWRDGGEVFGGRIARRWNVRALPTTYVIDHRGIIRHKIGPRPDGHDLVCEIMDTEGRARDKWRRRVEEIAAVVDQLIAEKDRRPDAVPRPSAKSATP
jgi:peroxiredoxin